MDELIGRALGAYQITGRLGQGGMATVFKAYQPALQRYVAVKVLPPHLAQDPMFGERFVREARAIARLDHQNILPVYDFGQSDGITYIVMKYVEGGTLKDVLERGKVPFDQSALLLEQVALALDYAHGQGIIHRDVKPANVLMARPDWALLSDFGLAKVAEATVKLTGTGVGMGTPEYMAPEQAHGLETDARADIYSLGVTLYAMVTGQVPYTGSTPIDVILKHVNAPLPSPRAVNPMLPLAAEAAILKAMAKKPQERPSSASELSRAFTQGLKSRPQAEATRLESPGGTILEPQTMRRPGATVLPGPGEPAAYPPGAPRQPPPGRGATVLEPAPTGAGYPPVTQPPAAWPPAAPAPGLPPVAQPAARRGGLPWLWIGLAVLAVVCAVGVLGAMGVLRGLAALGGGATVTVEPPTVEPVTNVPPTLNAQSQVEVVSLPEGASATNLFTILQPPSSDVNTPGTSAYSAIISSQDGLDVGPYWCAMDAATLEDNWSKTSYAMEVDGRPIDVAALRLGTFSDDTCRGYFALARGWSPGQHRIVITRTFSSDVFDGWCTYGAGNYVDDITITALTPAAATAATEQSPGPLGSGQRVVEDFGGDRGIYTYQGACRASQSVSGGALHQTVSSDYYAVYAALPGTYNNFELTVEATFNRVDGSGAEYGLHFRRVDSENYYAFLVSDDQQFLFGKLVSDEWSDITAWTTARECNGYSGGSDTLGVVADGSRFEFYCNGSFVGQADDSTFGGGAIALETGTYDATYAEVTFDNVSVTGR